VWPLRLIRLRGPRYRAFGREVTVTRSYYEDEEICFKCARVCPPWSRYFAERSTMGKHGWPYSGAFDVPMSG
jgi:hypothetical protein